MRDRKLSRRGLLEAGVAGAATSALFGAQPLWARPSFVLPVAPKTKRVILVAFAGGVRTRETLGTPANVPNLMRMASEGVAYTRARTANLGHFGATLSLFTGIAEPRPIRDNARGNDPTLFEYVRKDLGLAGGDVWVSTSGGAQQSNYSSSLHPDYGPRYGANTLDGDGIFNQEFRSLLDAFGKPRSLEADEDAVLRRLRGAIRGEGAGEGVNSAESMAKVERYILDELRSGTVDLRGTGASDAKALRVARNLLAVFRPKLLGVVLRDADVAHGNFNAYVEVIRRGDTMLGELWEAVKADPELADSTSIFVVPEFGRDADLNSRRGLDHGDGSDDLNYVSLVCWGPDFKRGRSISEEVRTIDVCSSACQLLGVKPRFARGRMLPKLLA